MLIECQVHFEVGRKTRKTLKVGDATPAPGMPVEQGHVPRVSRLMALAIRFDHLVRSDAVADQADLAHLGHVTRARVTQIMNLLQLAPDIQEEILFLPATAIGPDPVHERSIRSITVAPGWRKQRKLWQLRLSR